VKTVQSSVAARKSVAHASPDLVPGPLGQDRRQLGGFPAEPSAATGGESSSIFSRSHGSISARKIVSARLESKCERRRPTGVLSRGWVFFVGDLPTRTSVAASLPASVGRPA
jgi:hypothetical protein